ncbi:hypothetical protein RFI_39870 [Reticulomyxa filosa]|uniref:Uncharacterized protein n=1 Tax=Reticulomyxa filosa TaxID=46433 RepID=X6L7C0_RETFI|nr:hypothetical protein RFI_39870 [Reticulomyxa filosa]|eukprot:ETN97662.1 hypothetical protein RFI_39870 [Reticulomyxa filosa]
MPRLGSKKGTYEEVFTGTKLVTRGGLTKDKLYKNDRGKIVSKARHEIGKKRMQAFTRPWDSDLPKTKESRDFEMEKLRSRLGAIEGLTFEDKIAEPVVEKGTSKKQKVVEMEIDEKKE